MVKKISLLAGILIILFLFACGHKTSKPSQSSQTSSFSTTSQSSSSKTGNQSSSQSQASASTESRPSSETASPAPSLVHRLEVPMQVQRRWNTCAPTAVSMILASRGLTVDQDTLATLMETDENFGTHNVNAIRVLNQQLFGYENPTGSQAGYRLATVTSSDPNSEDMRLFKYRLKRDIDDGYPLYYTVNNAVLYPGVTKGEHNVVGTGYQLSSDGQDITALYYIDPSPKVQDPVYAGLKKVSPEELLAAMVACEEPHYAW